MARVAQPADSAPTSAYVDHRSYVLAVLGRRCRWLDEDDREAIFHDAYAVLLEKDQAGTIDLRTMHALQIRAFLVQTAVHKALDEGKRAWRKRSVALNDEDERDAFVDTRHPIEDLVAGAAERARLLEIISELPDRQQTIVKLRFFFDREPVEIQRYLNVTERSYRRELERAMKHIARRFELVVSGDFCESRRSVILALVAGIAGPGRADAARRHLATCPACASWAAELRTAVQQSAAVIPMPVVLGTQDVTLHERLFELVSTTKQYVTTLMYRVDPTTVTAAGGARPGTVAATVAACAVACGGATYGTISPVRDAIDGAIGRKPTAERAAADQRRQPPQQRAAKTIAPTPTPIPTASPPPADERKRERRASRPLAARAQAPIPPPDPADATQEFGLESVAPPPPPPPPAPPGEFDP